MPTSLSTYRKEMMSFNLLIYWQSVLKTLKVTHTANGHRKENPTKNVLKIIKAESDSLKDTDREQKCLDKPVIRHQKKNNLFKIVNIFIYYYLLRCY